VILCKIDFCDRAHTHTHIEVSVSRSVLSVD
jgi:hypothetical protein